MGVMNIYKIKTKNKKLGGAKMFGKISTSVLFIAMIILVLFPFMPSVIVYLLTAICSICLIVSWVGYFFVFKKL